MLSSNWDYTEVVTGSFVRPFLTRGAELAANISFSSLVVGLLVVLAAMVASSPYAVEWRRRLR